jgi:hypothetical protein
MTHCIIPSSETASRVRELLVSKGDRHVARALGVSRFTCCRVAARLSVLRVVVIAVESQLDELERATTSAA